MLKTNTISLVTSFLILTVALPNGARAQGAPTDSLHACFVPASGTVYRIRAAGLPAACHSASHVPFSWNARGQQECWPET